MATTDADGNTTTNTYDADNRLVSVSTPTAPPLLLTPMTPTTTEPKCRTEQARTSYSYNARDLLTQLAGPEGTFTYTYDADGT